MNRIQDIGCAIMAGGKATRYQGINKAFIEVDGKKIIDRILEIVQPLFNEIIIVTDRKDDFTDYKQIVRFASDIYTGIGPLGGIHAALDTTHSDAIFVVSCDMPFISEELVKKICKEFQSSQCDILIPCMAGKNEPMHAIYSKKIHPFLSSYLPSATNYRVFSIFAHVNTVFFELENNATNRKTLTNINQPDDLNTIK